MNLNPKQPRQFYLIILLLFVGNIAFAQRPQTENSTCLSNAERAYRDGQIEVIRETLQNCLELKKNKVSKEIKARGYRLLTITYLYFNENDSAEYFMKQLLKYEKEYKVDENQDPSEFVELYNRFRTDPVFLLEFQGGVNNAIVRTLNNYSLGDTETSLGEYTSGIGFSAGILFELPLSNKFSAISGINYTANQYHYERTQFELGYSKLELNESIQWMEIPLIFKFYFSKKSFKPFIQLGVKAQYLLSATANLSKTDFLSESSGNSTYEGRPLDISPQREKSTFLADAAIGFNWKDIIGRGYLTSKIGVTYGLVNIANTSQRYANRELINDYNYVSNDFSIDNMNFMLGYAIPIYRPKLQKQIK